MKKLSIGFSVVAIALLLVAQGSVQNRAKAAETSVKPTRPGIIYVADFAINAEGVPGQRPRLLNRPRIMQQEDPAAKAAKLVATMAEALTDDLHGKSFHAVRLYPGDANPHKGWLVQGKFLEADQGSRIKRTMVGFGAGSTNMQVEVSITDLGRPDQGPFVVFGSQSKSGRGPGAVVFKNPYVAAAKFVLSKTAPDRDVKKVARKIAEVVEKLAEQSSVR